MFIFLRKPFLLKNNDQKLKLCRYLVEANDEYVINFDLDVN